MVVLGSPSLSYIYAHIPSPVLIASLGERREARVVPQQWQAYSKTTHQTMEC